MDPLLLSLVGGGLGLFDFMSNGDKATKQQNIEQAKALTSPWLGMQPKDVKTPSAISSIGGGALSGYDFGQKLASTKAADERSEKLLSLWEKIAGGQ